MAAAASLPMPRPPPMTARPAPSAAATYGRCRVSISLVSPLIDPCFPGLEVFLRSRSVARMKLQPYKKGREHREYVSLDQRHEQLETVHEESERNRKDRRDDQLKGEDDRDQREDGDVPGRHVGEETHHQGEGLDEDEAEELYQEDEDGDREHVDRKPPREHVLEVPDQSV